MFDRNRLFLFKGFLLPIDELRTQWVSRIGTTETTVIIVIFLQHEIDINNKINIEGETIQNAHLIRNSN